MSSVTKAIFHTSLAGGDRARILVEWRKQVGYVVLEDSENQVGAFVVSTHATRKGAVRKALRLWNLHEDNADEEAKAFVAKLRKKAEFGGGL